MKNFRIGNVVKLKGGYMVIITGFRTIKDVEYADWISFSSSNISGGNKYETTESIERCNCDIAHGYVDDDCEDCKGTGKYTRVDYGLEDATLLADNVKSYIINCLTKNFDF